MSDNSVLFIGGTIHTMSEGPRPEAVRVDGDRITAVGRVEELAQLGDELVARLARVAERVGGTVAM